MKSSHRKRNIIIFSTIIMLAVATYAYLWAVNNDYQKQVAICKHHKVGEILTDRYGRDRRNLDTRLVVKANDDALADCQSSIGYASPTQILPKL